MSKLLAGVSYSRVSSICSSKNNNADLCKYTLKTISINQSKQIAFCWSIIICHMDFRRKPGLLFEKSDVQVLLYLHWYLSFQWSSACLLTRSSPVIDFSRQSDATCLPGSPPGTRGPGQRTHSCVCFKALWRGVRRSMAICAYLGMNLMQGLSHLGFLWSNQLSPSLFLSFCALVENLLCCLDPGHHWWTWRFCASVLLLRSETAKSHRGRKVVYNIKASFELI